MDLVSFVNELKVQDWLGRCCNDWWRLISVGAAAADSGGAVVVVVTDKEAIAKRLFFTKTLPLKYTHQFTSGVLGPLLFILSDRRYSKYAEQITPDFAGPPADDGGGGGGRDGVAWEEECLQGIVFAMGCVLTCCRLQGAFSHMPVLLLVGAEDACCPSPVSESVKLLASALHHSLQRFPQARGCLEMRIAEETDGKFSPRLDDPRQVHAAVSRLAVAAELVAREMRASLAHNLAHSATPHGADGLRFSTVDNETWASLMAAAPSCCQPESECPLAQLQDACSIRRAELVRRAVESRSLHLAGQIEQFVRTPRELLTGEGGVIIPQFSTAHWARSMWLAVLECQ